MQKKIISVVGARPNFMKVAPIERAFREYDHIQHLIVHTGQHYDRDMSEVFFEHLGLPSPERDLGIGSGGHGEMTGRIMIEFEKTCVQLKPDMVIVVGDVNSTIAASLVARKLFIPVSHVEAGLRSFDETMPEELNRRLTDCLSNLLFVSEPAGVENLKREGVDMTRVHLVGDIMLETLQIFFPVVSKKKKWEALGFKRGSYALVTLHRPSNVDSAETLAELIDILEAMEFPLIFPIHPRTLQRARTFGLAQRLEKMPDLMLTSPQPYIDFLSLMEGSRFVFSDSGSVQSEASFFNIPCLVCRENTEHPIYIEEGTSSLVGRDKHKILDLLDDMRKGHYRESSQKVKELGSRVGERIVQVIANSLNHRYVP